MTNTSMRSSALHLYRLCRLHVGLVTLFDGSKLWPPLRIGTPQTAAGGPAAVDDEINAGHVGGFVRDQKQRRASDLLGLTDALDQQHIGEGFIAQVVEPELRGRRTNDAG